MNKFFESNYLIFGITTKKNRQLILDALEHLKYLEENDNNTWKYRDTSDYYFTQRPIGGDRSFSILNLNISNSELTEAFLNHGLVYRENNIYVEDQRMDDYRQNIEDASCFGNSSYAIFFSSENGIVKYIWLDYDDDLSNENDRFAISQLLNYLGEKYSFILIDWYEKLIVDLSIKEIIIQYLVGTTGERK